MKNFSYAYLLSIFLIVSSCSSSRINLSPEVGQFKDKNGLTVDISWIKLKREQKYDFQMFVTNTSNEKRVFYIKDMTCFRGEEKGIIYNHGETDTIYLDPNVPRKLLLTCDFDHKGKGDFRLYIPKFFTQPSLDSKEPSKPTDIQFSWILPENMQH